MKEPTGDSRRRGDVHSRGDSGLGRPGDRGAGGGGSLHFTDKNVDRFFLVGCSPYTFLQGTKSELEDLFSTPPTDGVHRCRTPEGRRDPHDVAMWSWVYLGGPQPGPGMLTNHIRIFVDGEELWSRETRVDRPLADPTMITWGPATMSKAIPDPTQGEEVILRRSDGKPILPTPTVAIVGQLRSAEDRLGLGDDVEDDHGDIPLA